MLRSARNDEGNTRDDGEETHNDEGDARNDREESHDNRGESHNNRAQGHCEEQNATKQSTNFHASKIARNEVHAD